MRRLWSRYETLNDLVHVFIAIFLRAIQLIVSLILVGDNDIRCAMPGYIIKGRRDRQMNGSSAQWQSSYIPSDHELRVSYEFYHPQRKLMYLCHTMNMYAYKSTEHYMTQGNSNEPRWLAQLLFYYPNDKLLCDIDTVYTSSTVNCLHGCSRLSTSYIHLGRICMRW